MSIMWSLTSLDSLGLAILMGSDALDGATEGYAWVSLLSFMLSLRCMTNLQHNSKDVRLFVMRLSCSLVFWIPRRNLGNN